MSKKDEALKLALEALEEAWYHVGTFQPTEKAIDLYDEARTALREALDKMAENARELGLDYEPAQQKQKRWAVFCQGCRKEWSVSYPHPGKSICADCDDKLAQCDASQRPAQQEPVATVTSESGNPNVSMSWWHEPALPVGTKIYTSPPNVPPARASKPWVGLTQQDINIAFDDTQEGGGFDDFARAIEAKLREKNAQPSKPLTDEQIIEMYNEPRSDAEMLEFARAIEAKLREKNNG